MPRRSQFATEAEWLEHLRLWFAGQALGALVAFAGRDAKTTWDENTPEIVDTAYAIADAMLAERERKDGAA